jgi:hypothetical protein
MGRQVRGVLFADYVRMLRAHRDKSWEESLSAEDLALIEQRIDPAGWYPMETFERLGLAILKIVAHGKMNLVEQWGSASAGHVAKSAESLVVPGDPRESLMRFQVFRRTFFDFEALSVLQLNDASAELQIGYGMSEVAEEAASVQTAGFFKGLVELAGATAPRAFFTAKAWKGDPHTVLQVVWTSPS